MSSNHDRITQCVLTTSLRVDYELETLLELDGCEGRFPEGYWIKIEARRMEASEARPHGIKYSLTLHDPAGNRIYGLDNAHSVGRRVAYDHRHVYGAKKVVAYRYRGADALLQDFYDEVERILKDRGVK